MLFLYDKQHNARLVFLMKNTKWIYLFCLSLLTVAAACSGVEEEPVDEIAEAQARTGMALTMDILDDTDVAGMSYTVIGVDCATGDPLDPAVIEQLTVDLEDMLIPGGNPDLEGNPFDANSGHLFADHFFWLPEGCYDVYVQPVNADGEPSEDCHPASAQGVEVVDGQTTEITLISQCDNDGAGGLDVIAAINHAPQITDVIYQDSKFTCTGETTICVTVSDPDNDPLQAHWSISPDARFRPHRPVVNEDGQTVFCADFLLPNVGDYQVQFTTYDLAYDADGNLIPIEELLQTQAPGVTSNDMATFPIHVQDGDACICTCPEGFELNEAGDACERFDQVAATFNGTLLQSCEGDDLSVYGYRGARFPGGLTVENSFFGQNNSTPDGRLNEIGLWACGQDLNGLAGTLPYNEWIGFSRCLEVPEGAEYVVGVAADNQVRFKVDGATVFSNTTGNTSAFNYWWMTPITLSAGVHVIEMEGLNLGAAAAFGAEIYGPFPAGSTSSDASMAALDYANNIIWSTGEQIGQPFLSGTNSGYSCPDGYAISTCTDEITCTLYEEAECE